MLHPGLQLVRGPIDDSPPLEVWSLGSVEHKKRQEALTEKLGATKEKKAKFRIFAFFTVPCVKEPDRSINTYSKATTGGLKFSEGKSRQRSG